MTDPKRKQSANKKITTFIKNFKDWFKLKPRLDKLRAKPPEVEEGNIWWCRLGENIGFEISGKGKKFTRPVIVYKKFSKYMFLVIPATTKLYNQKGEKKADSDWYHAYTHQGVKALACLSQIRVIDYRRMNSKIGYLDDKDMADITTAFENLYSKKPDEEDLDKN